MTLEDFFTLTEIQKGLTNLSRVEKLVSILREDNNLMAKDVGEAIWQWSTAASILAATDRDTLVHFLRLDGLQFINLWLQKILEHCNDISEISSEESIGALLSALEKLPIDFGMSISSGVRLSVNDLLQYKSASIQERAKALLDSWDQGKEDCDNHVAVQSMEFQHSRCSDGSHFEKELESIPCQTAEKSSVSTSAESEHVSSANPSSAQKSVIESLVLNDADRKDSHFQLKKVISPAFDGVSSEVAEPNSNGVEEMESQRNLFSSITGVSASEEEAPKSSPVAPQHSGNKLWERTAATSDFHPGSSHSTDGANALVVDGSSSTRHRQGFPDFDLNVVGEENNDVDYPMLASQIPASSGFLSGESLVEERSETIERIKLDLNCLTDNADDPSQDRMVERQFLPTPYVCQSLSPASSSSLPTPLINFNLSNSSMFDSHGQQSDSIGASSENRAICLFGVWMREQGILKTPPSMPLDASCSRPSGGVDTQYALPYVLPSGIGLMGSSMAMASSAHESTAVPYTGDSSEASVISQTMGSVGVGPFGSRMLFPTMASSVDSSAAEVENRAQGPIYIFGQDISTYGHMSSASQAMNSVVGVKRSTPDGGHDLYLGVHRRDSPWH